MQVADPELGRFRIADYACSLGLAVDAVGFDISHGQLEIARRRASTIAFNRSGSLSLRFMALDLTNELPWPDGYFHIVLSNYVVLNHIPRSEVQHSIAELCRVSAVRVIATLRALCSPATACIVGCENVRRYSHDSKRGQLKLWLDDGSYHCLTWNLYDANTIRQLFATYASVLDIRAVDIFSCRFTDDAEGTAESVAALPGLSNVFARLAQLEAELCRQPGWIDHGTHVLVIAEPRPVLPTRTVDIPSKPPVRTVVDQAL